MINGKSCRAIVTKAAVAALTLVSCLSAAGQSIPPIVIHVENGAGPYSRSEAGKPAGLAYELVAAIFSEAKIDVDYRLAPYARCMAQTKRGIGAGCLTTAKNKEIVADYAWHARPFIQQKMVIVVRADDTRARLSLSDLYGSKVIAVNGYTYADDFYAAKPHLKLQSAVNDVLALQMLHNRRADFAILEERIMAFNLAKESALKSLAGRFRVAGRLDPLDGYISFSKTQAGIDNIIKAFDDAQARLERAGVLAAIHKRHDF